LPSPKPREWPAINGTQLKRRDLDTLLIFALHLKFPPVLPGKPLEVTASEHCQKQTSQASNCCASSSLGKGNLGSGRCAGLRLGQDKGLKCKGGNSASSKTRYESFQEVRDHRLKRLMNDQGVTRWAKAELFNTQIGDLIARGLETYCHSPAKM
jgi:hypothetical protein